MENIISKIQEILVTYGIKAVSAIFIFVIGKMIAKGIKSLLNKILTKSKVEPTLISFICNIAYVGLLVVVIIASLNNLGIQTTSLIAVLGAAGLAVGLALQGSLSNFASGVLLIIFRPFKVGDYIEAGGTAGIVEDIDIFTSVLKTPDNKTVIIPNSNIYGGNITNYSAKPNRRVDLVIGVSYEDDLKKSKSAILDVLNKNAYVLKDPIPQVGVLELADSSVNFVVRPWVKTEDYWTAYFELMQQIKEKLDEEGISIPFPQRDIHIKDKQVV